MLTHIVRLIVLITVVLAGLHSRSAADRPNILWVTAEDMSPVLGCYGDEYATTPHLDRFADQSVRYTHAFATAPVCSPSRNCLITGCYPTTLGTHNMRSAFPLPDDIRGFPEFLREAGYFTTNNAKTDYNTGDADRLIRDSWDRNGSGAHWRQRDEGQPFFSVFNLMVSHQSRAMVWPYEQFAAEVQSQLDPAAIHDPAAAPLPPWYPDTPVMRRTLARFYDCVTVMDQQFAEILAQLEADGLADDTIVFFYSDHGTGLPRHKRVLLDSGLHVPLIIRFPETYQHLAPAPPGSMSDRLVSFVDFPPTVLALAGIERPNWMQGKTFLTDAAPPSRDQVFAHRDRIDEVFDMARAIRTRRYLYVRNFMPHLGHNQPSAWPDAGPLDEEFAAHPQASPAVRQFTASSRPVEELYDCEADPLNVNNLADSTDPQHRKVLLDMQLRLTRHFAAFDDFGFIPEARLFAAADEYSMMPGRRPAGAATADAYAAALGVGLLSEAQLGNQLADDRPDVLYWTCLGLCGVDSLTPETEAALQERLTHADPTVRIAAADALGRHRVTDAELAVLTTELTNSDLNVVLHAMRTIELLGDDAAVVRPDVASLLQRTRARDDAAQTAVFDQPGEADLRMFIEFSATAFLNRLPTADE